MIDLEKLSKDYVNNWGPHRPALKAAFIKGGEAVLNQLWKDPKQVPPPTGATVVAKILSDGTYEICWIDETGLFESPKIDHSLMFSADEVEKYMVLELNDRNEE